MVKHIVLWKIKGENSKDAHMQVCERFSAMLEELKKVLPEIVEARAALNFAEGAGFDMCIDSTFKSREDLDKYIYHPEHLKIREYLNSVTSEKAVFDYEF